MKLKKAVDGRKSKILKPWQTLKRQEIFSSEPWIRVSVEKIRLPDGRIVDDYHQIHLLDCVVIFAETAGGKVVVEKQYKHGVRKVTFMLPTGGIEKGEKSLAAARRELKEETGFVSEDWEPLGSFTQMGNYGGAVSHLFLARNARKVTEPVPSDLEEMEIVLLDKKELMAGIRKNDICVLNTVTAILLATHPLRR